MGVFQTIFKAVIQPFGSETGAFTPIGCYFARNAADAGAVGRMRLDCPRIAVSLLSVVAVPPQWAETFSLLRYPSPYRRFCTFWYGPPSFPLQANTFAGQRSLLRIPTLRRVSSSTRLALVPAIRPAANNAGPPVPYVTCNSATGASTRAGGFSCQTRADRRAAQNRKKG